MRLDIDSYKEIIDTLTRNKSRSFLTGFGIFWGVFMLIILIGGGQGLKEQLAKNFEGFATNSMMIFSNKTTIAYDGFRKGREWTMTDDDIYRLRHQVPELETITPMVFAGSRTIVYGDKKSTGSIKGVKHDYKDVQSPKLYYGRYINEVDEKKERHVCIIGKKIYQELFASGTDPCGQRIKVGNVYYQVIGVDFNNGGMSIGSDPTETITIPFSLCRKQNNYGKSIHILAMTGRDNVKMSSVTPKIRNIIAHVHRISPEDEAAISAFNCEVMFSVIDSLFAGVNFLIWLIGIGTILAGAIGVSNIMMVTVKERTTEIGIRRAIGATPRMILTQILSESLVLTAIAGMGGILFGVLILQMFEMASTTDGIVETHFQVPFWTALSAAFILSSLGMLAGLAPAFRATNIKPVDAMREE